MNENLIEMVVIIDRSGSMATIASDTIGGYNSLITEQKKVEGDANVTLALFDHEYEVVYNNVDINEVELLTSETFVPRGTTAMFDAIGRTIVTVGERLSNTAEEERPFSVVVTIITDGYENASKEYTSARIKEMIDIQQDTYNWEFIFLAANMDAASEGEKFGIRSGKSLTFSANSDGTDTMMKSVSMAYSSIRGNGDVDYNMQAFADTIDSAKA